MLFFQLIEQGKKECMKNAPAPCTCGCPLGIDIRDMMQKFRKGLTAAAYKVFALNAVLPGTVCHICHEPCRQHCVRKDVDEAVSLKAIERYCWQQMHEKPKRSYFIREKKERILICGGEPAELVAAVKLARRGYPVDLAVKGDRLAGSLWDMEDQVLPKDVLEEDLQEILSEKCLNILWNTARIPFEKMMGYDAVLAAGEAPLMDPEALKEDKVFRYEYSGSPLYDIDQGNLLSQQIEEFVKIHRILMTKEKEREKPYIPAPGRIEKRKPVIPTDPADWTQDEVMEEANRCILCQCSLCTDVCPVMQHYHYDYPQLASAVLDTVEAQEIDRKRGLYPLMSCLQCGACKQVCPVGIDTRSLCLTSRRMTHKKKILPDAHYHFWLQDMFHADHAASFLIPSDGSCRYVYFPGCQMGASYPAYVEHSYEWLRSLYPGQTALWHRCCGAPANWSGNEMLYEAEKKAILKEWEDLGRPKFILSCPTCMERFSEALPEIETMSLWSLLAEHLPQQEPKGGKLAIFDSCAARDDEKLQQDIRRIVSLSGWEGVEPEGCGGSTRCCGYGGLVYSSNPELVQDVMDDNAARSAYDYVTYCTNCMDSFRLNEKGAYYIFDLIFDMPSQPEAPDLTQRRKNRTDLKKRLIMRYLNKEMMEEIMPYQNMMLEIDTELKRSMNKQLLLEEDIKMVIGSAEENSRFLYDAETDAHIAHKQIGHITVWVRYKPVTFDRYQVHSVYFHRMKLKGDANDGE